jgi:diguanylate cyclase (GGDEF)-like protein
MSVIKIFSRLPLRVLLTVPYVLMVVLLALIVGVLSYRAGRDAVDEFSGQLLIETVNRIAQAVDRHVAGSAAVLEAAFPQGVAAPESISGDMAALRTRFWLATSVHRDPNNYAYYGDEQGRFFGLWRYAELDAELRLRTQGSGPRSIHRFSGIGGELQPAQLEQRIFDPRQRPWYRAAQAGPTSTWTSIYIDFKTTELVATRARRVDDAAGRLAGVVATDLSLRQVNQFLTQLALSSNGVAMVVEANGDLIGVSRGPHLLANAGAENTRLNAANSSDPLVAATYRSVQSALASNTATAPRTGVFEGSDGRAVQVGYARLRDKAGLDWIIMVAVPRHDFLQRIETNFIRTGIFGLLAALAVVLVGLAVLAVVTNELRRFVDAAKQLGNGQAGMQLRVNRRDELGDLARSFADMQTRLTTDALTGLCNREAVVRRIEDRIAQHRRSSDAQPFVLMFADLNDFKTVNDRFGHDVGDAVLREVGQRLRAGVRTQDTVARYAGDEFLILFDAVHTPQEAHAARAHLEAALRQPLDALAACAPNEPGIGASFGVALYPEHGQDVASLVQHADLEMYRRKRGDDAPR